MKKIVLGFVTLITLLFLSFGATADEPYQSGDVLGNGTVTINDALEILKYLAKLPSAIDDNEFAKNAACVVSESEPNINDALEILKKLAKLPNLIDDYKTVTTVTTETSTQTSTASSAITATGSVSIVINTTSVKTEGSMITSSPVTVTTATATTTSATTSVTTLPPKKVAESFENDFDYTVVRGVAEITGYKGKSCDVVIPDFIKGLPVAVRDTAFLNQYGINSVTFVSPDLDFYKSYNAGRAYAAAIPEKIIPAQPQRTERYIMETIMVQTGTMTINGVDFPVYSHDYIWGDRIIPAEPERVIPAVAEVTAVSPSGINLDAFKNLDNIKIYVPAYENADLSEIKRFFGDIGTVEVIPDNFFTLTVETLPDKVEYIEGEMLDTKGLTLNKRSLYGESEIVDSGFVVFRSPLLEKHGNHRIVVDYEGREAMYDVIAIEDVIVGIEVLTLPDKVDYFEDDNFDKAGLSLTATRLSGKTETVKDGFGVQLGYYDNKGGLYYTKDKFYSGGTIPVKVTLDDCAVSFDLEVTWLTITEIKLLRQPSSVIGLTAETRQQNVSVYINGAEIEVFYNNGTSEVIRTGYGNNYGFNPGNFWNFSMPNTVGEYVTTRDLVYSRTMASGITYRETFEITFKFDVEKSPW